jgi:hypothetical protein
MSSQQSEAEVVDFDFHLGTNFGTKFWGTPDERFGLSLVPLAGGGTRECGRTESGYLDLYRAR